MIKSSKVLLELHRASKIHGSGASAVTAMRDVSLRIRAGEHVAIMGPSGSGKSTCLALLGCLDVPSSGTVLIEGRDVTRASPDERALVRRRQIGFVFQAAHLVPGMSALANVELPLIYRSVPAAERRRLAEDALAAVGLAGRARHRPTELSGGQQQRVAIARATVSRPTVLIADEPTASLDSQAGAAILDLLTTVNRRDGVAVVMVTHDRSIAEVAPRLITFRDGTIVDDTSSESSKHVA